MGAISSTLATVPGTDGTSAARHTTGPEQAQACVQSMPGPTGPGGTAAWAKAHTQGWARPWGAGGTGPSLTGSDARTTHCMPVGVQISVTGPLATAGTTQAPSRPCSAEKTVHSHTTLNHLRR